MTTALEDKEAIRELMATYCFCSDSADADALIQLFTPDSVWDGGPWGRHHGPAALRAFMISMVPSGEAKFRHINVNHNIKLTGDKATVRSYIMVLKAVDNPPEVFFIGYYDDQLVKIDGRWLFKERIMRSK